MMATGAEPPPTGCENAGDFEGWLEAQPAANIPATKSINGTNCFMATVKRAASRRSIQDQNINILIDRETGMQTKVYSMRCPEDFLWQQRDLVFGRPTFKMAMCRLTSNP
jgi:hypothetical protein